MAEGSTMKAQEMIRYMESLRNDEQRQVLMGFFKTGPRIWRGR